MTTTITLTAQTLFTICRGLTPALGTNNGTPILECIGFNAEKRAFYATDRYVLACITPDLIETETLPDDDMLIFPGTIHAVTHAKLSDIKRAGNSLCTITTTGATQKLRMFDTETTAAVPENIRTFPPVERLLVVTPTDSPEDTFEAIETLTKVVNVFTAVAKSDKRLADIQITTTAATSRSTLRKAAWEEPHSMHVCVLNARLRHSENRKF